MRVESNLKKLLDDRGISIREFEKLTGLPFETLRRLYNDTTKQYQRNTIARVCQVLEIGIEDLLILKKENGDSN